MNTRFLALIFDCDGVLVNSEEIAVATEIALLRSVGVHYNRDDYVRRYCGTADADFLAGLNADARQQTGKALPDDFPEMLSKALRKGFDDRLAPIDGAGAVAAGWTGLKAVASSTSTERLIYKLQKTGLLELFGEHVYSADLVPRAKPHPDIFLYAANALGVTPERCVVVEDSRNGILAARRAGMTALGLTAGAHCLDDHASDLNDAGAEACFATFADLATHLNQLV